MPQSNLASLLDVGVSAEVAVNIAHSPLTKGVAVLPRPW